MAEKGEDYTVPDDYANLDELAAPSPVENPHERSFYRHESLEEDLENEQDCSRWDTYKKRKTLEQRGGQDGDLTELAAPAPVRQSHRSPTSDKPSTEEDKKGYKPKPERASKFATQIYTISHLIFWSIVGTLARLGLQTLTFYPGAPVQTGVVWANFGGSLVMGFLSEDRRLFREEWGSNPTYQEEKAAKRLDEERGIMSKKEQSEADEAAARKQHSAVKKTIPLYIGLATGFCGSFTSFSSFIRDVFFALSNSLPVPGSHPSSAVRNSSATVHRNGGYSFMAVLAVILLTTCLCLGALQSGAHLAIALEAFTPTLPYAWCRKFLDRGMVVLAWGAWLGAILLAIWPADRPGGPDGRASWSLETWRGEALYALVFAPLGSLLRFYASVHLNGKIASFPLGTFAVNIFGTILLGVFYDLQHAPLGGASEGMVGGGRVGCQVLQGCMDGFCGCLTTVSTWVAELKGLRIRHAYVYGCMSVGVALGFLVSIIGSLKWTVGFASPACVT
ncbi:MAG: hypothetical protein LQ347_001632 [Umbilicaria vellea]|nr:MAG: hypothetical protein LQ347_001632 [Umbilicaria vellea]